MIGMKEKQPQKHPGGRETLLRLLSYVKRYTFYLLLSLVLSAGCVFLTLYLPILTGNVLDAVAQQSDVAVVVRVFPILLRMLVVIGLTAVCQWVMSLCNNRLSYRVACDIRRDAFAKLQVLPLGYLDGRTQGEMVNRIITDVDQISDGLLMGFTQLFTGVLTILSTLIFMLSKSWIITLVVVLITPVSLFVAAFIAKNTYTMFSLQSKTRGEQTGLLDEMLTELKMVQAYGREAAVTETFDEINDRLKDCSLKATFFSSLTNPCTRFVNSLVYAGVAVSGAMMALGGNLTVGGLTVFLSYANQYTKPFNEISGVVTELQNAFACAAKVFELIDAEPEPAEDEDAIHLQNPAGCVEIQDVCFSYTQEQKLIEHFHLTVKPGQRVAIVGPTGCGKTTIINLLMRFYDVNSGSVSVDGTDIRHISRKSLRDSYGMVLQEVWLREGTILDNLRMGNENATEEEVIAAAKECHAHSFIKRLPEGYHTMIGSDGGALSQGQKQLLCITRAMLYKPSMLILDEATSSIDTRTEIRIQKAFHKLMKGKTSFVVAHRLSTIRESDIILVMRAGKIVEQGNHEELLAQDGFYAQLYRAM